MTQFGFAGLLVPAHVLDFAFGQDGSGLLANMIQRQDTKERGILIIANAAGAEEIIKALEGAGMTSTVSTIRAALAQPESKPGDPIGIRSDMRVQ
jgi:hypothetical protein